MTHGTRIGPRIRKKKILTQPVLHRLKYIQKLWPPGPDKDPWDLSILKGALTMPEDLTLLTVSTVEPGTTFLEQSLDFVGIDKGYEVLRWAGGMRAEWRNIFKMVAVLNHLQSRKVTTPYVLYCDAFDAIITGDLQTAIDTLKKYKGVRLLTGSTMSPRGFRENQSLWEWTKTVGLRRTRYLCAGVFIGETDYVMEVLARGVQLIGKLGERSYYSDQDILRHIHQEVYPLMDIDYFNELSYRN